MKKLLSFFAFVAIVLTFAACGGNEPEPKDFTVKMNTLTATDASFTITPMDEEADYFWYVYPKLAYEADVRSKRSSSEEEFIDNWLKKWANPKIQFGMYDKSIHGQKGTVTINEDDVRSIINNSLASTLAPNYEHRIAICKIDAGNQRVGDVVFYSFKTEIPEGYVDLGLPSGNLWTTQYILKNSQPVHYTYSDAWDKWAYNPKSYEWFPTTNIWQELRDNCTWTWETNGSMKGYRVTSKKNGNSIFLWAAGWINTSGDLDDVGYMGFYWTEDMGSSSNYRYAMIFTSDSFNFVPYSNKCGFSLCFYCPNGDAYYD